MRRAPPAWCATPPAAAGLACAVSLVGHVDVNDDPPYDSTYKAFWPDPLLSFLQQSDVKAGEHVASWIDVASSKTTPAGDYRGSIEISADGCAPVSIPLLVRVWGFALPDGTHLRNAVTYHEDPIRAFYKGGWDQKLAHAYQDLLLDHRLGIDHLYRGEPPDVPTLQRAVARGMNGFNVILGRMIIDRSGLQCIIQLIGEHAYAPIDFFFAHIKILMQLEQFVAEVQGGLQGNALQ